MDEEQAYTSLQAYLEYRFSTIDSVTTEMVKKAKAEYRKIYQSRYRKQYRERYVQVTFRIDADVYNNLKNIAQQLKIKVTTLIKKRALQEPNENDKTNSIKEPLLILIDQLEEAIHEDESVSLNEILETITMIYQQL